MNKYVEYDDAALEESELLLGRADGVVRIAAPRYALLQALHASNHSWNGHQNQYGREGDMRTNYPELFPEQKIVYNDGDKATHPSGVVYKRIGGDWVPIYFADGTPIPLPENKRTSQ
jgi:hypothetical protein